MGIAEASFVDFLKKEIMLKITWTKKSLMLCPKVSKKNHEGIRRQPQHHQNIFCNLSNFILILERLIFAKHM